MTPVPPITGPAILLFRGRGVVSSLIRWQSRGPYSHAAILLPSGQIVESWQGAGVRVKTLTDWSDITAFTVPGMTEDEWDRAIRFCLVQVGKPYDYLAVARFLTRQRGVGDHESWFCSELIFEALRLVGKPLFHRIEPWAVSPNMLAISPLLQPVSFPRP
jgi:uncharacterized protein YycO